MTKPAIHLIEDGDAAERFAKVKAVVSDAVDADLGYTLRTYTLEDGTRAYEVIIDAQVTK